MPKNKIIELQLILDKIEDKKKQMVYLRDFLETVFKGSNAKQKAEYELRCLSRELDLLKWIINDDQLPF